MLFKKLLILFNFYNKKKAPPISLKINGVQYYSQWESPSLVGKIIRKEFSAQNDPFWKRSGAKSPKEYELWAKNMCGMACLKMIIKHKFGEITPIVDLGKRCLNYGGYILKPDTIDGLYYTPFVKFVKKEFSLDAKVIRSMSIDKIIKELSLENYIIASVHHQIKRPNYKPLTKGGHLILLLGYDLEKKIILFHNPSGDTDKNQEYAKISFLQFEKFFAKRGIVIKK